MTRRDGSTNRRTAAPSSPDYAWDWGRSDQSNETESVSFEEVPGWALEVRRDDTGRATGAAWMGTLDPGRIVQLPFVAVNPSEPATLTWIALLMSSAALVLALRALLARSS
jgi:hypothetical protein